MPALRDLVDLHAREVLAVPDGAPILLLALAFEDQGLLGAVMFGDGAFDHGALGRRAGVHTAVIDHGQNAVKFHLRAHFTGQRFDLHRLAWRHPILFPARFNHCVHTDSLFVNLVGAPSPARDTQAAWRGSELLVYYGTGGRNSIGGSRLNLAI